MNMTPEEREKLRKRLRKLFQKQEKDPVAGNASNNQQKKQVFKNNKNKQQQSKPKVPPVQNIIPAEKKGKQTTKNQTKKSEELKKDVPKVPKLQKNTETKEKESSKNQSQHKNFKFSASQKQNKVKKQIVADKIQKKLPKNETKSPEKLKNKNIKNQQQNGKKPLDKNFIKQNIGKTKKPIKRNAVNDIQKDIPIPNKKQKLIKKGKQIRVTKVNKKEKALSDETEYDVSCMTGQVNGGDFDSDHNEDDGEHRYWMQEENYSEDDSVENHSWMQEDYSDSESVSDNNFSETNTAISKFEMPTNSSIEQFYNNTFSDSDEFNISSDNDYEYDDEDDSEEEVYESEYSSSDDSYDSDSDTETEDDDFEYSSSDYSYDRYTFDEGNHQSVPEDVIIHSGTASTRNLTPEDNVSFDSSIERSYIIELKNQETVKTIHQPKAYDKAELLKLKFVEKPLNPKTFHNKETTIEDAEDCPKLVPIVDDDGFQLYNPNEDNDEDEEANFKDEEEFGDQSMEEYEHDMDDCSLGSEYTEINSDDAYSLLSEDINDKYLNEFSDSDGSIDEHLWLKNHKGVIIESTSYTYENNVQTNSDHTEVSVNDDIEQILSVNLYNKVDSNTTCNILSTPIIADDDHEQNLSAQHIQKPEPEIIASPLEQKSVVAENTIEELPKAEKPLTQRIVNYNTKFFNAFFSNSVMVLLKDPFNIYGTVRLTLLAGSMEIYGHTLKLNTEVEIFSPRGCSLIEISSLPTKTKITTDNLKEILKSYEADFTLNDLKTIANLYNPETDAVVLLKRNEARKKLVQQFKKHMNENVFPNINNINVDRPLYNTEYMLCCIINTSIQEQKCLRLPQDWQQFSLTSNSRVMVAGGKSVGKSTLLRYLINRHLPQKVLLIDLDIGQPEVFIPQTISCTIIEQPLLGPGFMLNLQPEISYAIGHTNIALCAHKYLSAVHNLMAYCKEQEAFKNIPWLINTMGYNKGFGLELISILAQEELTDLIQIQSSKEINNFESSLHADILSNVPHILFSEEYERNKKTIKESWNYRLHIWPSAIQQESRYQKEWEMSPKDLRYAMLLARLSAALQGHAEWLTDVKPLRASLEDLKIINLLDNTPLLASEDLEKAIEANLVYLCHYEEDLKPLICFGIGVVRAIDFHVRQLFIIPALPYTQLKDVNCLAIGEMPMPTSLYTNQGPRVKNIAPFVYSTVAANASKGIKQIYHRPEKFLTGKHKSLD